MFISPNLRFLVINMPFADYWNPFGTKKNFKILTKNGIAFSLPWCSLLYFLQFYHYTYIHTVRKYMPFITLMHNKKRRYLFTTLTCLLIKDKQTLTSYETSKHRDCRIYL